MALTPEAQAQLAELATTLAHNPETRRQFVNLVRKIDPSKRFADVEADEMREEIRAEFATRDQAREAERVLASQEAQRNNLISSGRFKAEEVKEIETRVMEKYGISDYDAAAKIYAADHQPARPTSEIKSRTWQMPQIKTEDIGNLKQYSLDKAYAVVDELRGRKPH